MKEPAKIPVGTMAQLLSDLSCSPRRLDAHEDTPQLTDKSHEDEVNDPPQPGVGGRQSCNIDLGIFQLDEDGMKLLTVTGTIIARNSKGEKTRKLFQTCSGPHTNVKWDPLARDD
ncbi:hypothetical protein RRG08_024839 [Elysia crispata]|uniref:Uncharacterized protein n=1 Tax=Elysia crispata TaxID=231223 RepID=A0AAE0YKV6_9GAST|nr:hypothetical protein RRG08_024839 [Elysia crispata]